MAVFLIAGTIATWWAFKMNQDMFQATGYSAHMFHHEGDEIWQAGVCPLGKVGAWLILLWSVWVLYAMRYLEYQKMIQFVTLLFIGLVAVLSLLLNYPLFVRSIPVYLCYLVFGLCYF